MKQESNRIVRAWIWFWYNDITRLLFIMMGGNLLLTVLPLLYFGVHGETVRSVATAQYMFFFAWALIDNDYTNLNRIGLTAYRKPMKK